MCLPESPIKTYQHQHQQFQLQFQFQFSDNKQVTTL